MEVAIVSIPETSFVDLQPSLTAMEVDGVISQQPDEMVNSEQVCDNRPGDNVELDAEIETETEVIEDEESDSETKEFVLKGILKHEHIYGLDKKNVNFDLDIGLIPYNDQDYCVYIEIVKELPKRVVSYKELFKKIAEEEKLAKEKAAAGDNDTDSDEEEVEVKPFGHLVLKEPPHHGLNDIDLKAAKELKSFTKLNEKNDDTADTSQQDSSQEQSNIMDSSDKNSNTNLILGNKKFSVTTIDESSQLNPTDVFRDSLITNESLEECQVDSNRSNPNLPEAHYELDEIEIVGNGSKDNEIQNPKMEEDPCNVTDLEETRHQHNLIQHPKMDTPFNCDHEYFYSCDSSSGEFDSAIQNGNSNTDEQKLLMEDECKQAESFSHDPCELIVADDDEIMELIPDQTSFSSQELLDDLVKTNSLGNNNGENLIEESNKIILDILEEEKPLATESTDEPSLADRNDDDFKKTSLLNCINESISESECVDKFSDNISPLEFDQILMNDSINEKLNVSSDGEEEIIFNNTFPAAEMNETVDCVRCDDALPNGCLNENKTTREVGTQTEFHSPLASHCLLCTCSPQIDANSRDDCRFENVTDSILHMHSLNQPENIEKLAQIPESACQENSLTSPSTDCLVSYFKDFTQSTNLNCSSSMSTESLDMDDDALRIQHINGNHSDVNDDELNLNLIYTN